MAAHVEKLTGSKPPTCPWRVFYDPLVSDVIDVVNAAELGISNAILGEDPPWILLEAVGVFQRAKNAVKAHDHEQERLERERNRPKR